MLIVGGVIFHQYRLWVLQVKLKTSQWPHLPADLRVAAENITHFFKLSCSELSSALSFGAYSRTISERFAFLLHWRQTTETCHQSGREDTIPVVEEDWCNFLLKHRNLTDLRTFSGRTLSLQPALDAGEAEEMSAAQGGQSVFARCRPRLKADGAVVAIALLAVWWRDRSRGHRDLLGEIKYKL